MSSEASQGRFALAGLPDPDERLGQDDMATRHEAEFLAISVRNHDRAVLRAQPTERGVCTNCGERCLPMAVYCDEDCRADHETRDRARTRNVAG